MDQLTSTFTLPKRGTIAAREGLVMLALALATVLIFGAVTWQMIYNIPGSDYQQHIGFARDIVEKHEFVYVHILYQALIIGLASVFPVSLEIAGWMSAVIFYVIAALILYMLIRAVISSSHWRDILLSAGITLALMFVTPVTLASLPAHNLYFGYVGINVTHNPTIIILRPFALLLFAFALRVLNHSVRLSARIVVTGVLLVGLSLLAKPNFVLVLLPALIVVIAYRLYKRERTDLRVLLIALVIPMIVLLALQYLVMYIFIDAGGSGIMFMPLLTLWLREPNLARLPLKFLLSILFPAAVYLLYQRQARHDLALNFGWLMFFIGALQMYLFAEQGWRVTAGNFWWSAQIALFILFVASTLFWLRHFRDYPRRRGLWGLIFFLLHLVSGLIFYLLQFQSTTMWGWW